MTIWIHNSRIKCIKSCLVYDWCVWFSDQQSTCDVCIYLLVEMMSDSVFVILPIGGSLSINMSMLSISSSVVGVTTPGCSWKMTAHPTRKIISECRSHCVQKHVFSGAKTEQFHFWPPEGRKAPLTNYWLCISSSHKFDSNFLIYKF